MGNIFHTDRNCGIGGSLLSAFAAGDYQWQSG